jgi:DNA-binding transcriptional MerR regulator
LSNSSAAASSRPPRSDRQNEQSVTLLTVGKLARKVGVRPSAIRYYEAQGILRAPNRSASGYRLYGPETVALLQFIRRARELGFSLEEIRQLVEASRQSPPCALSRRLIARHLTAVESEIVRLSSLRDRLKRLMNRPALEEDANGVLCPLIEGSQV